MANFASIAFVLMQSLLVFTMLHPQLSHSLQSVACNFTRSASVFKFATETTFDIVILMFYILRLCCVQQQNIAVVNWLSCYFEQVTHRVIVFAHLGKHCCVVIMSCAKVLSSHWMSQRLEIVSLCVKREIVCCESVMIHRAAKVQMQTRLIMRTRC